VPLSFQAIILRLQSFWARQGCVLLQSYDMEMGAGTFHPATALRTLEPRPLREAFVQLSRRPKDGRYGQNPNRLQKYHQFQVLLKPSPDNIQALMLDSFEDLGIDLACHDVRFVEDDWESPTLGASGLGWEVWLDGMEVLQFTYFQQMGGIACRPVTVELTYGLERVAMVVQKCSNFYQILWNDPWPDQVFNPCQKTDRWVGDSRNPNPNHLSARGQNGSEHIEQAGFHDVMAPYTYKDLFFRSEVEFSKAYFEVVAGDVLWRHFEEAFEAGQLFLQEDLVLPAYEECIRASHLFNVLESRGGISVAVRASQILRIRDLAAQCCDRYLKTFHQYA
jgi:glycyl-tRNA synthetase alpha chain